VHALLLQLLLPLFHHPVRLFAGPAEIAHAMSAMAETGMAHHVAHHAQNHSGHDGTALADCPLCLAVQQSTPFVPPSAPVLVPPLRESRIVHAASSTIAAPWQSLAARARGPPHGA
jgi:hypothetical protein